MNLRIRTIVIALSATVGGASHSAGLEGANANFGVFFPSNTSAISQIVNATVGAGVEFQNIGNLALPGFVVANANVNISASQISFTYTQNLTTANGTFNGYVLNFSGPTFTQITGVSLDPSTNISTALISLSFDSDSVFISLPNTPITANSILTANIQMAPVPEPSSIVMLTAGLAFLGLKLRREQTARPALG